MEPLIEQSEKGRIRIQRAQERATLHLDELLGDQPSASVAGSVADALTQANEPDTSPEANSDPGAQGSDQMVSDPLDRGPTSQVDPEIPFDRGSGMDDGSPKAQFVDHPSAPSETRIVVDPDIPPFLGARHKRPASQCATTYNDEVGEGSGSSSSSTAAPTQLPDRNKRICRSLH